jgi:GNAT superfamily N-acetyltransferase
MTDVPASVRHHLTAWFGGWNEADRGIVVVESEQRTTPGWDGKVLPVVGLTGGDWAVLSVAPGRGEGVRTYLQDIRAIDIAGALALMTATFRWCTHARDTPDVGEWVPTTDIRVPEWLRPFNGDVLISWDDHGAYGAGVGRKMHNPLGHEISVGTEPALRGRGIAQGLVETAARRILADGAVATYIHLLDNFASGKVAERAGFPDTGWQYIGTPEE